MSIRFSEALPRMKAGEVLDGNNGYAYRVRDGELQDNDPQFADDEGSWKKSGLPYNDLEKLEFNTPLSISDKARALAKEEEERNTCITQIPCSACRTMRNRCPRCDIDCPSFTTAYGMQVLLNWLAGHGVKEGK